MKVCATCGRHWGDGIDSCPEDGTALRDERIVTTGQLAVAVASSEALAPDTMVGEYRIERQIGEGGMGMVYGARHPVIGKRAAIKVLNAKYSADREAVARFVQEAQAVNTIGHANIVDVFAFGALPDGRAYLVMEWLQGETLGQRLERGPLPIDECVAVLVTLSRALEAAHTAGVIHRDLKPDNVFLVAGDDGVRVKLLDFGIAKLQTGGPSASRTATGVTVGTPLFMSPEQAKGTQVDARTDIYALGVLAYAMVCGKTPFEHETSAVEVLGAHIARPPPPPHTLRRDIPQALEMLILQLLAKRPEERPTLADVRRRLGSSATQTGPVAIGVSTASLDSVDEFVPKRRGRWIAAALVAVAAAGAALAVVALKGGSEQPDQRGREERSEGGAKNDDRAAPPDKVASPAPATPDAPPAQPAAPPEPPPPPPPPPPKVGVLDLAIDAPNATASVDGRAVQLDHGRAAIELAPGRHAIAGAAPGYKPVEQNIEIAANDTAKVSLHLHRVPRTHATTPTPTPTPTSDTDAVVDPFHH
jgi:serine/threonine-protein kinase